MISAVGTAAAVTREAVHPGLGAIAYALRVICQNLLGFSLGPMLIGALRTAGASNGR